MNKDGRKRKEESPYLNVHLDHYFASIILDILKYADRNKDHIGKSILVNKGLSKLPSFSFKIILASSHNFPDIIIDQKINYILL